MQNVRALKLWVPLSIVLLLLAVLIVIVIFRPVKPAPSAGNNTPGSNTMADSSPCNEKAFLSGTIVRIDATNKSPGTKANIGLRDPAQAADPTLGGVNMIVGVLDSTRVFRQQGNECLPASASDLKAGQNIKVWSKSGTVLQSYPGQLRDTSDIVIVS